MSDGMRKNFIQKMVGSLIGNSANDSYHQDNESIEEMVKRKVQEEMEKMILAQVQQQQAQAPASQPQAPASQPQQPEGDVGPDKSKVDLSAHDLHKLLKMMTFQADNAMSEKSAHELEKVRRLDAEREAEELKRKIADLEKKHETVAAAAAQKKLEEIEGKSSSDKPEFHFQFQEDAFEAAMDRFFGGVLDEQSSETGATDKKNQQDPDWFPRTNKNVETMNNFDTANKVLHEEMMGGIFSSAPVRKPNLIQNTPPLLLNSSMFCPPGPLRPVYAGVPPTFANVAKQRMSFVNPRPHLGPRFDADSRNFSQCPQQVDFTKVPNQKCGYINPNPLQLVKKPFNPQQQQQNQQQHGQNNQQPKPKDQNSKKQNVNVRAPSTSKPIYNLHSINSSPHHSTNVKHCLNKNKNEGQAKAGTAAFKKMDQRGNEVKTPNVNSHTGAKKKVPPQKEPQKEKKVPLISYKQQQKKKNEMAKKNSKDLGNQFPTYNITSGKLSLNQTTNIIIVAKDGANCQRTLTTSSSSRSSTTTQKSSSQSQTRTAQLTCSGKSATAKRLLIIMN